MFNYKEFKREMQARGHKVCKRGIYISIVPNNNHLGYGQGFDFFQQIIDGFEKDLQFVSGDHYNTYIYEAKFKIVA